jgi:hypothetical protein
VDNLDRLALEAALDAEATCETLEDALELTVLRARLPASPPSVTVDNFDLVDVTVDALEVGTLLDLDEAICDCCCSSAVDITRLVRRDAKDEAATEAVEADFAA